VHPHSSRATAWTPALVDLLGGHPGEARSLFDWREWVRTLRRRCWPALTVFVIVFIAAFFHALTRVPVYQARVRVLIEPNRANVTGLTDPLEADYAEADFLTQFMILQSRSLARRTMETLGAWDQSVEPPPQPVAGSWSAFVHTVEGGARRTFAWARERVGVAPRASTAEPPAPEESVVDTAKINGFLSGLRVTAIPGSRLVDVFYESRDPHVASTTANTIVQQFIQQNLELRFLASKEVTEWLNERLREQRKALDASVDALRAYQRKNGIVPVGEQASMTVQKLTDLTTAYTKAKTERIEKETMFNQIELSARDRASLDAFPVIANNPLVQELKSELIALQRQESQLAEKLGDRHPTLIKTREGVHTAEGRLRAEVTKAAELVRAEYQAARAAESSLGRALESQRKEMLALNRSDVELAVLQRDMESNRQIYDSLLQRVNEFGVTREQRISNLRIVDRAEVPQAPLATGIRSDLRLGLLGGLLLAIGMAFLLERLDNRVKLPEQIGSELGLTFLGMVPLVSEEEPARPLLVDRPVPAGFGEAIRAFRTNVRLSIASDGLRSVVVTSACAGDGKTLVASNLALTLAMAEQRVLLIDADLRRPSLHTAFDLKKEPGLTNFLIGDGQAASLIRRTRVPGLHILTSGTLPPNPSELLDSRRFKKFISQLGKYYDWVVLDSPPVMPVTDAIVLADVASGVIFVTAAEITPLPAARSAIEQLRRAPAPLLGAVLNRADLKRRSYYYTKYYRREYEGYYERATPA
jgi:capsular exopolysaccharide synthesis family protein